MFVHSLRQLLLSVFEGGQSLVHVQNTQCRTGLLFEYGALIWRTQPGIFGRGHAETQCVILGSLAVIHSFPIPPQLPHRCSL